MALWLMRRFATTGDPIQTTPGHSLLQSPFSHQPFEVVGDLEGGQLESVSKLIPNLQAYSMDPTLGVGFHLANDSEDCLAESLHLTLGANLSQSVHLLFVSGFWVGLL